MSIVGTWAMVVKSPMGSQKSTVTFASEGGVLTGTSVSPQGTTENLHGGTVDGDAASWQVDIKVPMPMTLVFEGTVSGDSITGSVKAGTFGSFPFTGERA